MDSKHQAEFRAYSPEGFELICRVSADTAANLRLELQALIANGITALPYDPNTSDKEGQIAVVIRREYNKGGERKRCIDAYIDRMKWRFVTIYLDDDARAIAEFEAQSGLTFARLPVLNSQTALERDMDYPSEQEVSCKPFVVRKTPTNKTTDKGEVVFRFAGYVGEPVQSVSNGHTSGPNPDLLKPAKKDTRHIPQETKAPDEPRIPHWFNEVYNHFIRHPHFNGIHQHMVNAMNKLIGEDFAWMDAAASDVIEEFDKRYPHPNNRRIS